MARNQTLPAWPDLLLLLLEYFPDVPLSSKRGGGRGFFFFLGLTNLVNLPSGPRRAARQLRAYKSPLGPFLAHFSSPLYSSLSTKIS